MKRRSSIQKRRLEGFFKNCPRPNETQRQQQVSQEPRLEPVQIKAWSQNRKTQQVNQRVNLRVNTEALKVENEKLQSENLAMMEAIAHPQCPSCLKTENVKLTKELARMSNNVDIISGKQISKTKSWPVTVPIVIGSFGRKDVTSSEGIATVIHLSDRMVKFFLENANKLELYPDFSNIWRDIVQVSVRNSNVPSGNIVIVASSLWLGLSQDSLFDFFDDEKNRYQWDIYTGTRSLRLLTHIPTETRPGNRVSVFQDSGLGESALLLQRSYNYSSGSTIVYAPIKVQALSSEMMNNNPTFSPTGFIISGVPHLKSSGNGASTSSSTKTKSATSLLTIICQMSFEDPRVIDEAGAALTNIITKKVMNIKAALNC